MCRDNLFRHVEPASHVYTVTFLFYTQREGCLFHESIIGLRSNMNRLTLSLRNTELRGYRNLLSTQMARPKDYASINAYLSL
jgi:hypothetical protein